MDAALRHAYAAQALAEREGGLAGAARSGHAAEETQTRGRPARSPRPLAVSATSGPGGRVVARDRHWLVLARPIMLENSEIFPIRVFDNKLHLDEIAQIVVPSDWAMCEVL